MKIVVIGGSGLIGTNLVDRLRKKATRSWQRRRGRGSTPSPAKDWLQRLRGPRSSSTWQIRLRSRTRPSWISSRPRVAIWLAAGAAARIGHHLALSVVGADRLPESGYLRAKVAQERLIKASGIPYTILRATQFFEFIGPIADSAAEGDVIRLSPALLQPIASDDVAAALADLAVGPPLNDTVEVAGPDACPLDKLARKFLAARGDKRQVIRGHPRTLLRSRIGRSITDARRPSAPPHDALRRLAQPHIRAATANISSHASKGTRTMNTITTKDGTEIYYKDWGPKNAQPIVFHHGWPLSGDDWDTQMLYFLDKGYRVIAHDRRGHGRSAQVSDGHDMDHYAADVAAVVEHLDLRNAVHIGHSTGGGEATRYVARHGQPQGRVAKLVLIGAVPPIMVKTPANPGGLPIEVFDGLRRRSPATGRSSISISRRVPSTASTGRARSPSRASSRTGGGRP